MSKMYVLEINAKNVSCQVIINDIKAYAVNDVPQVTTQLKASQFLEQGNNVCQVKLAKNIEGSVMFECKLLSGEHGTQPGDETIEFEYKWEESVIPLTPAFVPVWQNEFSVADAMPGKLWHSADICVSKDSCHAGIFDLVKQFEKALQDKSVGDVLALTKTKHQGIAASMGIDVKNIEEGFSGFLNKLFSDSAFQVIPVMPEQINLDIQGKGRLVEVTNITHSSVIPVTTSGMPFQIDMSVAKLNGVWIIVQ